MNNLIKIILIILILSFLFKNNKVEKFTKNIFDSNVTLKLIPCDKNSQCKEKTYLGEKYGVCNVTEDGNTNQRYCLNKKQIRDNCLLSKFNSENKICNKISKQPTINDSENIFNSNVTLKLIPCDENSPCIEGTYGNETYAVCNVTENGEKFRYCLKEEQIRGNCNLSIFNSENDLCYSHGFLGTIPARRYGGPCDTSEGKCEGGRLKVVYKCDPVTGKYTGTDGSVKGECEGGRYI